MPSEIHTLTQTRRPNQWRLMGLLGLGTVALMAALGCGHEDKSNAGQATMQRPPAMVTTATATAADVPNYIDRFGRIVAIDAVSIVPQVGGKLVGVHFTDGAFVKKGELLFTIDPRPIEAALASAEATLGEARAELQLARDEFDRYKGAVGSSAVSQMEYDKKKNAVAINEAKVQAAEAALQTAKLNLEYTKIFSPIDGRAGARMVDPGNIVQADSSQLLSIQRLEPIYAEFNIDDNELTAVRHAIAESGAELGASGGPHLAVKVNDPSRHSKAVLAVTAVSTASQPESGDEYDRAGELTFIDNTVHKQAGTVRLRATMPNDDQYFWPGQYVRCRLVLSIQKDAVLVPAEAQQIGQRGPFVYVVNAEQVAELRPIVPGQRQGDSIVVRQGVKPGEQVIVTGQMMVMPNSKVMVMPPGGLPMGPGGPGGPSGGAAPQSKPAPMQQAKAETTKN